MPDLRREPLNRGGHDAERRAAVTAIAQCVQRALTVLGDTIAFVPEAFTLNPYCSVKSPFQTSFNGLASYTIPKIDVLLSTVASRYPSVRRRVIAALVMAGGCYAEYVLARTASLV